MNNYNNGESSNGRTSLFESEDFGSIPNSLSISKCCTQCSLEKPLDEFAKKTKGYLGRSSDCKECHRKVNRARYTKDDKERNRIVADKKRKIEIAKTYITELKARSQCKCGYRGVALQFHHLGDKDIDVSKAAYNGWTLESIKREINKCVILCANCHIEEHTKD